MFSKLCSHVIINNIRVMESPETQIEVDKLNLTY